MTELEAVNTILRSSGFPEVASVSQTQESSVAKTHLDQHVADLLTQDWQFNTRFDVEVTADGSGHIDLPAGSTYAEFSEEDHFKYSPVLRSGRVYNRKDGTDVFPVGHVMTLRKLVDALTFGDMPPALQQYSVKLAENDFVNAVLGDPQKIRHTQETLGKAYQDLNKYRVKRAPKPLMRVPSVLDRRPYARFQQSRMS